MLFAIASLDDRRPEVSEVGGNLGPVLGRRHAARVDLDLDA